MNPLNDEIQSLYHDLIIDHGTKPHNFRCTSDANHHAKGYNPLCGDKIELYLKIENDVIIDACFQGQGCAISTASASLMTDALMGKSYADALDLFQNFQNFMMSNETLPSEDLGKLQALTGVRVFPARVKCATLAWHTLKAALTMDTHTDSNLKIES